MALIEDKGFSSVFGTAANGLEWDHVLEADEEDELIEAVNDFDETQGENDKTPSDIEDELEGRDDDGCNKHTDSFDIDMEAEAAMLEMDMMDESIDYDESQGEDHKHPGDIEDELHGGYDSSHNSATSRFNPNTRNPDISTGNYHNADRDLRDLDGATDRAARYGENLYDDGDLSTEAYFYDEDASLDDMIGEDDYESEELTGEADSETGDLDDYEGNEDFEFVGGYEGDEDFEMDESADTDFDPEDISEASEGEDDEDNELIDIADSDDDGDMSADEVAALVAVGGDDELIDELD